MNECPKCQHDLVNIIYGLPGPELIKMAKTEDVALGGLLVGPERPALYCYGCDEVFNYV
jgi:hypothetical protein